MAVQLMNPEGLPKPEHYCQLAIASGSRTVYLSGQVARDADGDPVGEGDLAAQAEQAFRNVLTGLGAAGASYADVAKVTIYVVDWEPSKLGALGEGIGRVAGELGIDPTKPTTMISVAGLGEPDLLIEIEAIAVVD